MVVRILYLEQGLIHSLSSASCHLRISMSSVGQADEAGVHGLLWLPQAPACKSVCQHRHTSRNR